MSLLSYFISQKIIEAQSDFNGKIIVYESQGEKYISVSNLIQTGSYLRRIWKKAFRKLKVDVRSLQSILLLGVAGGTFIKLVKKINSEVVIDAVDIDPVMISVGKTYFGLREVKKLTIYTADAEAFVQKHQEWTYDLIFVDLFFGYAMPEFLQKKEFLHNLSKLLSVNGQVIFNRMYTQNVDFEATEFLDKLKEIFHDVTVVKAGTNHLFSAKN